MTPSDTAAPLVAVYTAPTMPGERDSSDSVALLFITEVPMQTSDASIYTMLRKAGRDPMLTMPSGTSFAITRSQHWPRRVIDSWHAGQTETVTWSALQEETTGWRRITLRVRPEIYAIAQGLADRRSQSITQFCVDAIEAQTRTIAHRIEYEISTYFHGSGYNASTRSVWLPDLTRHINRTVPTCSNQDVVDALKRLHSKYVKLDKWADQPRGFYEFDDTNEEDFFYRAEFRIAITADGRPYFAALKDIFQSAEHEAHA